MSIDGYDLSKNLLIEAGAGTGKTYSIEHIVLRFLVEKKIPLKKMNILTFTRKAAGELKTRITDKINTFILDNDKSPENILKKYYCKVDPTKIDIDFLKNQVHTRDEATIGTIHSFCRKILLKYPDIARVSDTPNFVEEIEFSREYLRKLYQGAVLKKLSYKETKIYNDSKLKSNLQSIYRMVPYSKDEKNILNELVLPISKEINETMIQNGKILTMHLISLVDSQREEFAKRLFQDGIQVLVVDEFQDTDVLQWQIFQSMADAGIQIIVVGDPKQSIYRFRGADMNNYYSAIKSEHFANGRVTLDENFRSTKFLGDFYNYLFEDWFISDSELEKITYKPLKFNKEGESILGFLKTNVGSREFPLLASWLIISENLLSTGTVAFIAATNADLADAGKIFTQHGIPWRFKSIKWSESREVQETIYLLDAILDPDESSKICLTRFWQDPPETPVRLIMNKETVQSMGWFSSLRREAENRNWSQFFHNLKTRTALKKRLEEESDPEGIFFNYLEVWERMEEESIRRNFNLSELRNWMEEEQNELSLTQKEEDNSDKPLVGRESNSVILMTIHGSKGLEFDTVFVPTWKPKGLSFNPEDRRWELFHYQESQFSPSKMALGFTRDKVIADKYLDEEHSQQRRLYYVAYTRAKQNLFLGYGDKNFISNESIENYMKHHPKCKNYDIEDYKKLSFKKDSIQKKGIDPNISLPTRISYRNRQFKKMSFSSITTNLEFSSPEIKVDEISDELDEPLKDEFQGLKQIRGMNFGTVIHSIFEKIDFTEFLKFKNLDEFSTKSQSYKLFLSILKRLNEYRDLHLEEKRNLEEEIFRLIKETISTPLRGLDFSISEVKNYLKEERFLNLVGMQKNKNPNNYLVGAIDLIFEYNKLYYILDWKTNYLGTESLEIEMNAKKKMRNEDGGENYTYQGELYMLALKHFLESRGVKQAEDKIGGAIFYFVRHKHIEFVKPLTLNRYKEITETIQSQNDPAEEE